MKYLDKKILSGRDMKNIMSAIKNSTSNGSSAVKESIVENTAFGTFEAFTEDFRLNGATFVKTSVTLNLLGDEVDTGSIGGSDHRGSTPLNAEDIFDNSLATAGMIAEGFVVEFDRP